MQDFNREPLNFLNVVRFLFKWRYYFLIIVLSSGVLSYILASPPFTEPKYRSVTTFYPTSKGVISSQVLRDNVAKEDGYLDFGGEQQVESYLEILKSQKIKNHLLEEFDLLEHYNIDKDSKNPYAKFDRIFRNNVSISKTQFMAIEVSVLDKDPQTAAKIANEIVNTLDSIRDQIKKERALKTMKIVKKKFKQQKARSAKLADSLQELAKKGLVAFDEQSQELVEALGKAKIQDKPQVARELQERLDIVGKYGPVYNALVKQMVYVNERIAGLNELYQRIQADATQDLPNVYVLDEAKVSTKEAKPDKLLIVMVVLISTFLVTYILLRIYEKWKVIKEAVKE